MDTFYDYYGIYEAYQELKLVKVRAFDLPVSRRSEPIFIDRNGTAVQRYPDVLVRQNTDLVTKSDKPEEEITLIQELTARISRYKIDYDDDEDK